MLKAKLPCLCGQPSHSCGYCRKCYNANYRAHVKATRPLADKRQYSTDTKCEGCGIEWTGPRSFGKGLCRRCYAAVYRQRTKDRRGARRRLFRLKVLEAYGHCCVCCGETIAEFLALDHVNGGGGKDLRERGSDMVYKEAVTIGPAAGKFQLLCHNCNLAKGFYGLCPHEKAGK